MPAPNRLPPIVIESEAHSFTKGIVGYYTDLEVDALVAALAGGGGGLQTVDLSAYATTAYVDGIAATVYTKAEVDAAIAAAATGDVDLSAYALAADVAALQQGVTDANAGVQSVADSITFVAEELGKQLNARIDLKADQETTYTKAETDAAILAAAAGEVDLSAYATTQLVEDTKTEIIEGVTPALAERYTKIEVDALVAGKADQSEFSAFQGQFGTQEAEFREYFRLLNQGFATVAQQPDVDAALELKADKAETYTKLEVDAAIAGIVTGDLSQEQIDAIISQVGPVDLTAYAKSEDVYAKTESDAKYATKEATTLIGTQLQAIFDSIYTRPEADDRYAAKSDNTQNVVTNGVVAKGYTFGDSVSESNPGLVYTDTGEGYGPRLVLGTPAGNELIPYQSDFEPIRSRLDALESKADPSVDLAAYVTVEVAEAKYATKATTYTKTECDSKFLTIVDVNQYAYQANVYTQRQADDRFMRIDQAFSKADFDNEMALSLYSRKQVDDKLAVINPIASPSINDPALAAFKKSVLDEVKLMLAGGTKMPPADIDWTWMVRMDGARESVSTEIQARMIGGFIELKGTLAFGAGSGVWSPLRLPPQFPLAELEASYPLAMRLVGSAITYGYCTVSNKNRDIYVSPGARSSEAGFSGIRWKAAY